MAADRNNSLHIITLNVDAGSRQQLDVDPTQEKLHKLFDIENSLAQPWRAWDAIVLTELGTVKAGRAFHEHLCSGGELRDWIFIHARLASNDLVGVFLNQARLETHVDYELSTAGKSLTTTSTLRCADAGMPSVVNIAGVHLPHKNGKKDCQQSLATNFGRYTAARPSSLSATLTRRPTRCTSGSIRCTATWCFAKPTARRVPHRACTQSTMSPLAVLRPASSASRSTPTASNFRTGPSRADWILCRLTTRRPDSVRGLM